MRAKPHKQGAYAWFSLRQKDEILHRDAYHMFIDKRESEDIFDVFNDLVETAKAAEKLGIETDSEYIKEHTI